MANSLRGMVAVKLDKARNFKFGTNALREVEEALGIKVTDIVNVGLGIKEVQTLVYHGLKHEDNELTFVQAGDIMDEAESFEYVTKKMAEAVTLAIKKDGTKKK